MALKPGRVYEMEDISFFMNETAEEGGVVFLKTSGSGENLDQSSNVVTYDAQSVGGSGSAKPVGLLVTAVKNLDLTRQKINNHRDEVNVGGKVTIMTRGWLLTDRISSGTPTNGGIAYADLNASTSGKNITPVAHAGGVAARPVIGRFGSTLDEDSYVKVHVNLPIPNSVNY